MKLDLYKTLDEDNVLGKTLTSKQEVNIDLKDTKNITTPLVLLEETPDLDLKDVNYAYIEDFERYYFIRSINVGPNKLYELSLECDVLETYKDEVLSSGAQLTRKIKEEDYGDVAASLGVKKEIDVYESDKGLKNQTSIIFTTIGQDILDE